MILDGVIPKIHILMLNSYSEIAKIRGRKKQEPYRVTEELEFRKERYDFEIGVIKILEKIIFECKSKNGSQDLSFPSSSLGKVKRSSWLHV